MKTHRFLLLCLSCSLIWACSHAASPQQKQEFKSRTPDSGMLYFASYGYDSNNEVLDNPYIIGGLYSIHWSKIEPQKGKYDWTEIDQFIEQWTQANKKVALRIMWSSSGYWKDPAAATPTPQWVWKAGAKYVYHEPSKTEIPLFWDPIYRKYAMEFQQAIHERYGNNPNILFIDVTPGAETNPYRFGTINRRNPEFKSIYEQTPASDGRTYSDELWTTTVCNWISETAQIFKSLPCLITLNQGSLGKKNNFPTFGQCAVDNGMYVGQNGLNANSYQGNDQLRTTLFRQWSSRTKLFFEMVHAAETQNTGSMQEVIEAAQRIGCDYLNVYAIDVIKATPGTPIYDPRWETALKDGATWFETKHL